MYKCTEAADERDHGRRRPDGQRLASGTQPPASLRAATLDAPSRQQHANWSKELKAVETLMMPVVTKLVIIQDRKPEQAGERANGQPGGERTGGRPGGRAAPLIPHQYLRLLCVTRQ